MTDFMICNLTLEGTVDVIVIVLMGMVMQEQMLSTVANAPVGEVLVA